MSADFKETMLRLAREGIADCANDVDHLLRIMREAKAAGKLSHEVRIGTLAKASYLFGDPAHIATMLAVALDRIVDLEDFENKVPREAKS